LRQLAAPQRHSVFSESRPDLAALEALGVLKTNGRIVKIILWCKHGIQKPGFCPIRQKRVTQCCGSGIFIPDPDFKKNLFRIPTFIPDPTKTAKEEGKNEFAVWTFL
jgi:hypothetical protein